MHFQPSIRHQKVHASCCGTLRTARVRLSVLTASNSSSTRVSLYALLPVCQMAFHCHKSMGGVKTPPVSAVCFAPRLAACNLILPIQTTNWGSRVEATPATSTVVWHIARRAASWATCLSTASPSRLWFCGMARLIGMFTWISGVFVSLAF